MRKAPTEFRALAARLLKYDDLSEWESVFLEGIVAKADAKQFSLRQSEKLFEIRDNCELFETYRGFSVKTVLQKVNEARVDLSEADEQWIVALHARAPVALARRHIGRLFRCAEQLEIVDEVPG